MMRTAEQNKRLYALLNALHKTEEERGVLVHSFTDGRTWSSKEMTTVECQALIGFLQDAHESSIKKMRAKAINIALDIGIIAKQGGQIRDWAPLNKWTQSKWNRPFYALDYDGLRNCVTALENWRDGETNKMLKTLESQ